MNTFKSIGTKVMTAIVATGLVAGAAFAASGDTITVNLPQAVTVGSTTLASGEYKISETSLNDGDSLFVFRSDKGETVTAVAMRSVSPAVDQKTEVVLANEGGSMHLDKLFVAGEAVGYQFAGK